jgi:hypothetical protein
MSATYHVGKVRPWAEAWSAWLEEAIRYRWSWRAWYRQTARGLFDGRWDDLAVDNDRQIRRLVTLLRRTRAAR